MLTEVGGAGRENPEAKKPAERRAAQPASEYPKDDVMLTSDKLGDIYNAIKESEEKSAAERKAKEEQQTEDAFFTRGETLQKVEAVGGVLPKNEAAKRGEENARTHAMRTEIAALEEKIAELHAQHDQAEAMLRRVGVDDPTAMLAEQATGGIWGRVKRLFTRERDVHDKGTLLNSYAKISTRLGDAQARQNEVKNRLYNAEAVAQAQQLKAERGSPERR